MKISIIIPFYNPRNYIRDAINSICECENASSLEIIIIDDGSTDEESISTWKNRLTTEEIDRVKEETKGVWKHFYVEKEW